MFQCVCVCMLDAKLVTRSFDLCLAKKLSCLVPCRSFSLNVCTHIYTCVLIDVVHTFNDIDALKNFVINCFLMKNSANLDCTCTYMHINMYTYIHADRCVYL